MAMKKTKDFFPKRPEITPIIYAYNDVSYPGLLKIGYTSGNAQKRVAEQYPTKRPGKNPYKIVFEESAMRNDGDSFKDHEVHRYLREKGIENLEGEWFRCSIKELKAAILALKTGIENTENRTQNFKPRPEQKEAIRKTVEYFTNYKKEGPKVPHFLWNAKMRFGKTFATYQLAKKMGWKKILVLTFKPAVENSWREDLLNHLDFEGWQFLSKNTGLDYKHLDKKKPLVCFGSFQDYLGTDSLGRIKTKNKWVHKTHWDCVIFDEYHYGAWRDPAKNLFKEEENLEKGLTDEIKEGEAPAEQDRIDYLEGIIPIKTDAYLYLSGTPFRAILSGEFIEEQIFNWTYSDEQKAKGKWKKKNNPYEALPRMVLLTYQLPDSIINIASGGEFDSFDLNVFFSAKGTEDDAKFVYEDEVQKWLDLIRGKYLETNLDNLKLGARKPPLPFSDARLLNILSHTFWYLPRVASCYAMRNLLKQKQNKYYHDYNIVVAAGQSAGVGLSALAPVKAAMKDPLESKSITLSCGKLATGVTIKPWTGILMLRNLNSPESYFQAAFRVQSPWTIKNPDDKSPNMEEVIKKECYIFDFAPNRALKQIADYSCKLNISNFDSERKVKEFINFLPVLSYDGSSMIQIDAAGIIEAAISGTTATLLARRWESALLVNVDNNTLDKILKNSKALEALMNIEGFRSLNKDIEIIINKSEAVKKAKKKLAEKEEVSPQEKKKLSEEEKEYMGKRKEIQQKLIKFATRIPIFMYLTDFRERILKDVITKLEPALFKKVTGLNIKDFELLVSIGVFNSSLMNDAVFKFKRYEDSSLSYTGINKHQDQDVGGFDIIITSEDLKKG